MITFYACSLTKPSIFMIPIEVEHLMSMNFIPFSINCIFNSANLEDLLQKKLGSIWRLLIFKEMELSPSLNYLCSLRSLPQEVFSLSRTMVEIWDSTNMVSNLISHKTLDSNTGNNMDNNMGSNHILNNHSILNTLNSLNILNNQDNSSRYTSFKVMLRFSSPVRTNTIHIANNDLSHISKYNHYLSSIE